MGGDNAREDRKPGDDGPAFHYPGALPGDVDEADSEDLVFLCSVASDETEAMISLLAFEGILCHLDDAPAEAPPATDDSAAAPMERLFVQAEDLAAARKIVARPEAIRAEADAEWAAGAEEREANAIDSWVCPHCGKRSLVPLPLSPGWQKIRLGCFGILAIPVLATLLAWALPFKSLVDFALNPPKDLTLLWFVVLFILGSAIFLGARRDKICTECGWNSRECKEPESAE